MKTIIKTILRRVAFDFPSTFTVLMMDASVVALLKG